MNKNNKQVNRPLFLSMSWLSACGAWIKLVKKEKKICNKSKAYTMCVTLLIPVDNQVVCKNLKELWT